MPLRVSEKEAIARGWIPAPPLKQASVPPQTRGDNWFLYIMIFIAGWMAGFKMALMFMS